MNKPSRAPARGDTPAFRTGALLMACGFLAAVFLWLGAVGGPDYLKYLDWGWAFALGDIFRIHSEWASPAGVPLSSWPHGPGLFYAVPALLYRLLHGLSPSAARLLGDSLWAGWAAALVLGWALYKLIHAQTGGRPTSTLFWLAAAFIGTHVGYYARAHGSESLALGLLALLALWIIPARTWHGRDLLLATMLVALLILARMQLAVYAIPALGLALFRYAQSPPPAPEGIRLAAGMALILGLALFQILQVNAWMTGNWLQAPQFFGDAAFQSLDFTQPEFWAVLFHPWHGLFIYHPFYLLGVLALVQGLRHAASTGERVFLAALAVAMLAHLYLQAAWYCWWLGLGTFGMRGLCAWGVIMPLLVVRDYHRPDAAPGLRRLYFYGALASALWSFLLMVQGDTNFMEGRQLLAAQWRALLNPALFTILLLAGLIGWAAFRRHQREIQAGRLEPLAAWSLACLYLWWLFIKAAPPLFALHLMGALALFFICRAGGLSSDQMQTATGARGAVFPPPRAGAAILACFILLQALFGVFCFATHARIREKRLAPHSFVGRARVYWPEVLECYGDYQRVPGFERPRTALREYLLRQKVLMDSGHQPPP